MATTDYFGLSGPADQHQNETLGHFVHNDRCSCNYIALERDFREIALKPWIMCNLYYALVFYTSTFWSHKHYNILYIWGKHWWYFKFKKKKLELFCAVVIIHTLSAVSPYRQPAAIIAQLIFTSDWFWFVTLWHYKLFNGKADDMQKISSLSGKNLICAFAPWIWIQSETSDESFKN